MSETTTPAPEKPDGKQVAQQAARKALELIEQAQTMLYQAAQTACPLQGWADQWTLIGDHADATKALWHRVNSAPRPTGHDGY